VLCLHIRRGIVYAVVGDVKSSASRSNLRLAPFLIQALQGWRRETPYVKPSDWIFAKPENEREEALTSKLSRSPAAEARKEQDWNHYACGMAYISQVHRNLAD
jgi:hypothetical protein